jgi:hypothetical protein
MVADPESVPGHPPEQLVVAGDQLADQKERSRHMMMLQKCQQARRDIRRGTVVERQCDQAVRTGTAIMTRVGLRRRTDQRRRQRCAGDSG